MVGNSVVGNAVVGNTVNGGNMVLDHGLVVGGSVVSNSVGGMMDGVGSMGDYWSGDVVADGDASVVDKG